MDIAFRKRRLEKVFNSEKELLKEYGKVKGRLIQRRMTFLRAAQCLADVPVEKPFRRHELRGKRKGQFALDLEQLYRLVFQVNHNPIPRKEDGGIDLKSVTAITILGVEDYH